MNVAAPRPLGFWIVSVLALLWNLVGMAIFFMQINMPPEALAAMPAEQRALYESTPVWVNGAFAVAVFGGALGSAMLLMRKRLALPLLALSLLGVVVQMGYTYLMTPAFRVYGASGAILPALLVLIALFLVWFARRSLARGWIS
ncbi:hypothetical protein [Pseudoxanthomonas sacheonensis]|uniref:Sugar transporter n=1 Tax=Pseudoxanthomonas sacheonensis TaxID=443615 RepID=A0ABU1RVG1_9GAMM|nr:hypothetical protein [Pseudoxanthomonas sacheonensis]MDR6842766.1 hypothetical protein [Pseudoxanthomonas sacheonensis]